MRRAQRGGVNLRRDRSRSDRSLQGPPLSQPRPKPRPRRYWRLGRLHVQRAVIAVPREKASPYMPEHANVIEELLERHGPGEPTVRLSLSDDVFRRSSTWAGLKLGIPLPVEG